MRSSLEACLPTYPTAFKRCSLAESLEDTRLADVASVTERIEVVVEDRLANVFRISEPPGIARFSQGDGMKQIALDQASQSLDMKLTPSISPCRFTR